MDIRLLQNFIHSNYMKVHSSWLITCLSHFINSKDIYKNLWEQWLLEDLTITSPGSLPKSHKMLNSGWIEGHFTLQINTIWNYELYMSHNNLEIPKNFRKINKSCKYDIEKCMLVLIMTDGVEQITGLVLDRPIKNLYINTVPGCKVLIKGPVQLDKGFLLLADNNCELLGGEVLSLMQESYQHTAIQLNILIMNSPDIIPGSFSREEHARRVHSSHEGKFDSSQPSNKKLKTETDLIDHTDSYISSPTTAKRKKARVIDTIIID